MSRHWTADAGLLRAELTRERARLQRWGMSGARFSRLVRLTRHLARLAGLPYAIVERELGRDAQQLSDEEL